MRKEILDETFFKRTILRSISFFSAESDPKRSSPFLNSSKGSKLRSLKPQRPIYRDLHLDEAAAKESLSYCINLVKTRDFSNYVAALLFPFAVQPAAFALLAFNVELAVIREQIKRNSGVTGIYRLQFWKDTLDAIYGNANGPIPRQPTATALAAFVHLNDASLLNELISSRQSTLGDRAFDTLADVANYGRRTNGTLIKLIMNQLDKYGTKGTNQENAGLQKGFEAAEHMGAAVGIITLIRTAIPLLTQGVVLLPNHLMTFHKVAADDLYNNKRQDTFRLVVRDMVEVAEFSLLECRKIKDEIPNHLRIALLSSGAVMDFLISVLKSNNYNLLDVRLQRSPELLAWRLWWRKLLDRY